MLEGFSCILSYECC